MNDPKLLIILIILVALIAMGLILFQKIGPLINLLTESYQQYANLKKSKGFNKIKAIFSLAGFVYHQAQLEGDNEQLQRENKRLAKEVLALKKTLKI